ncbi:MAG: EamA family transporter [Candidatus Thiodiazotropha sp. LLP2]
MIENAYLLIGISVLMHVAWNLLARHVDAKSNYLWWGLLVHLLLFGPYAVSSLIANAIWDRPLFLALLISSLANTLYFIALRRAYHHAPVSLVYPLARSSPILIALWSWMIFDQRLTYMELFAISISIVGLWILAFSSRLGEARQALPWTITAAFATSLYSLSDKVAVDYLPSFSEQLGFISVGYSASLIGLSISQRLETGCWVPCKRPHWLYLALGGLCIGVAYALVVRAMSSLPASHVVSFTNAGIVLATLLSITLFRERGDWLRRLLGAIVVSLGLILLGWL